MMVDRLIGGQPYKYVNVHGKVVEALFNKSIMLPNNKTYYNFYLRKGFVNLTRTQVNELIFEKDTDDSYIYKSKGQQ